MNFEWDSHFSEDVLKCSFSNVSRMTTHTEGGDPCSSPERNVHSSNLMEPSPYDLYNIVPRNKKMEQWFTTIHSYYISNTIYSYYISNTILVCYHYIIIIGYHYIMGWIPLVTLWKNQRLPRSNSTTTMHDFSRSSIAWRPWPAAKANSPPFHGGRWPPKPWITFWRTWLGGIIMG